MKPYILGENMSQIVIIYQWIMVQMYIKMQMF